MCQPPIGTNGGAQARRPRARHFSSQTRTRRQRSGLPAVHPRWTPQAGRPAVDIPAALSAQLDHTRLDLHYNSGMSIAANGRELAALLQQLLVHWPVPVKQITLLGHSMGGLVSRSACHYGLQSGHHWLEPLRHLIFLGAPHHGSPLERAGHGLERILGISPYSAPFDRLGRIRSAGIIDLRHGRITDAQEGSEQQRLQPVMPDHVNLYAVAAVTAKSPDHPAARRFGDGLVTIDSALAHHPDPARRLPIPPEHQHILPATTHTALLHHPQVLETLQRWTRPDRPDGPHSIRSGSACQVHRRARNEPQGR